MDPDKLELGKWLPPQRQSKTVRVVRCVVYVDALNRQSTIVHSKNSQHHSRQGCAQIRTAGDGGRIGDACCIGGVVFQQCTAHDDEQRVAEQQQRRQQHGDAPQPTHPPHASRGGHCENIRSSVVDRAKHACAGSGATTAPSCLSRLRLHVLSRSRRQSPRPNLLAGTNHVRPLPLPRCSRTACTKPCMITEHGRRGMGEGCRVPTSFT